MAAGGLYKKVQQSASRSLRAAPATRFSFPTVWAMPANNTFKKSQHLGKRDLKNHQLELPSQDREGPGSGGPGTCFVAETELDAGFGVRSLECSVLQLGRNTAGTIRGNLFLGGKGGRVVVTNKIKR